MNLKNIGNLDDIFSFKNIFTGLDDTNIKFSSKILIFNFYHPLKTATGAALHHFSSYFQLVQLHVQAMVQAKEQIETRNRIA